MSFSLGILGGMGPLASAELVHSFYLHQLAVPEQRSPSCLLHSIPSIADRTAVILSGDAASEARVVAELGDGVRRLVKAGAKRVVIACMTAHHFVPQLDVECRNALVKLPSIVVEALSQRRRPHLLLATLGTLRSGLLTRHPQWAEVEPFVHLLDNEDAQELHRQLYRLKAGNSPRTTLRWLRQLSARRGVEDWILGCTELHLLQRELRISNSPEPLDPLEILMKAPVGAALIAERNV